MNVGRVRRHGGYLEPSIFIALRIATQRHVPHCSIGSVISTT